MPKTWQCRKFLRIFVLQKNYSKYMKLTNTALAHLSDRMLAMKIAVALHFSEQWIVKVIAKNKENGPLTTATALQILKNETGLSDDQLLVVEELNPAQETKVPA
jgi:hypothetical protein